MAGPGGLVIRAEVDWFEGEGPDSPCRGVDIEVRIGGEPVGNFGYTASPDGRRQIVDRLEPAQVARVADAIRRGDGAGACAASALTAADRRSAASALQGSVLWQTDNTTSGEALFGPLCHVPTMAGNGNSPRSS